MTKDYPWKPRRREFPLRDCKRCHGQYEGSDETFCSMVCYLGGK